MDSNPMEERDTVIDIDRDGAEEEIAENRAEDMHLKIPLSNASEASNECDKNRTKKKHSHKKPPRPPRGLSLDAADQKLIKEIAELAMIKRARIERMKALRKMKAANNKASSSSSNLIAVFFTIALCVLFILQGIFFISIVNLRPFFFLSLNPMSLLGCHSSARHRSSGVSSSLKTNGDIYSAVPDKWSSSINGVPLTSVESPNVMKLLRGSDGADERSEASIQRTYISNAQKT